LVTLIGRRRPAQPDDAQVPVPVPGQVDHDRPQVRERGSGVPQVRLLVHQPGERLLRDVLGVIGAEQPGQPDHLQVPAAEQFLDVALVRRHLAGRPRAPGFHVRHVPNTPRTRERLTGRTHHGPFGVKIYGQGRKRPGRYDPAPVLMK
jgi:hypothetical protein